MNREQAVQLVDQYVHSDWLKKHSLATAAIMERLAEWLAERAGDLAGGDPDTWWVIGMLHDLDFDITQDPAVHGRKSEEILQELGVDREIIRGILAHNAEGLNLERTETLDYAITAAESITGLIVATALVMPDKRLASVKPASVIKRMKKKDFARKVSRESIMLCEQAGIPLEEFAAIAVEAMQSIAPELDL
jgi:putative nucleotidyltransferase with HDIG domain